MLKDYDAVGFVGLGAMGFPMAVNLVKKLPKGTNLYVYDVANAAMAKLAEQEGPRVKLCNNAFEVAKNSDIILTMVPEGHHVKTVYTTPETGILHAHLASKLLIDCSTIDPATSLDIRSRITDSHPHASFFDAPVSGGVLGAENASLTFMLGCAPTDPRFPELDALLRLMGAAVLPCGGPSLGLTAKLCNNYCSGLIAIATAEAMNVGIRAGMDPRVLAGVFGASLAQSCINDKWNPCPGVCPGAPASQGYQGGFRVELMRKDFALAVVMAEKVGARLALGEAGLGVYTSAMNDEKCQGLDSRVVYRHLGGDEEWAARFPGRENLD